MLTAAGGGRRVGVEVSQCCVGRRGCRRGERSRSAGPATGLPGERGRGMRAAAMELSTASRRCRRRTHCGAEAGWGARTRRGPVTCAETKACCAAHACGFLVPICAQNALHAVHCQQGGGIDLQQGAWLESLWGAAGRRAPLSTPCPPSPTGPQPRAKAAGQRVPPPRIHLSQLARNRQAGALWRVVVTPRVHAPRGGPLAALRAQARAGVTRDPQQVHTFVPAARRALPHARAPPRSSPPAPLTRSDSSAP